MCCVLCCKFVYDVCVCAVCMICVRLLYAVCTIVDLLCRMCVCVSDLCLSFVRFGMHRVCCCILCIRLCVVFV